MNEEQGTREHCRTTVMLLRLFCEGCPAKVKNELMKGVRLRLGLLFLFLLFFHGFLIEKLEKTLILTKSLVLTVEILSLIRVAGIIERGTLTY